MFVEIEKRCHIPETEYEQILNLLETKYGKPQKSNFVTLLFKGQDTHARIRRKENSDVAVLTHKSGQAGDPIRKEINDEFNLRDISRVNQKIQMEPLEKFISFTTHRHSYKKGKLSVELSRHGFFGDWLEVEILLEESQSNQEKETLAVKKISQEIEALGLSELSREDYQHHMDDMFNQYSRPISELDLQKELSQID